MVGRLHISVIVSFPICSQSQHVDCTMLVAQTEQRGYTYQTQTALRISFCSVHSLYKGKREEIVQPCEPCIAADCKSSGLSHVQQVCAPSERTSNMCTLVPWVTITRFRWLPCPSTSQDLLRWLLRGRRARLSILTGSHFCAFLHFI
jgi:hypothetical protein